MEKILFEKKKKQTKKPNKTTKQQNTRRKTNNCKPADTYIEKQELLPSPSTRGNGTVQKSASKVHHSVNDETFTLMFCHKCDQTKTSHASFHPATTALFHNNSNQCYFHGSLAPALEYPSSPHSGVLLSLIPFSTKHS